MAVDKAEFRTALSRFASGVTVVTTRDGGGQLHGITVSAFCSVSLEPPLILICIDRGAYAHGAFGESGVFAVNVLTEEQESLSRLFASREPDKFAHAAHRLGLDGVPVLSGTLATLECHVRHTYEGGDHTIFVGEVLAAEVREGRPLAYYRGGYSRLTL